MSRELNPFSIKKYWKNQIHPDINYLRQNNLKFTDSYFPPNRNTFISCDQNGYFIDKFKGHEFLQIMERKLPGLINRITWKRATELNKEWELIGNNFEKKDILQGNIGDCYFLTALLALTQYPYLIVENLEQKNLIKKAIMK